MINKINPFYFFKRQVFSVLLFFISILFISANGISATFDQKLSNGFITSAEFIKGEENKPAIFIMHGFLQTREYLTVQSLISTSKDEGYTVLAPNLSLGISHRKKSLACEAIHNHDMNLDINEIDFWIKWLQNKGYSKIVLLGHSYGSLQLLIYANRKKPNAVTKIIATSLIDVEYTINNVQTDFYIRLAKSRIVENQDFLYSYPISYCKKFISPSRNYLSYAKWSKDKILVELLKLRIPITIILGGSDSRIDAEWVAYLKKAKIKTVFIAGANHFFDDNYEFDMGDEVLNEMLIK